MNDPTNTTADGPVTFDELSDLMKNRAGLSVDPSAMASSPATTFEEFNLDSLGLLGIVAELEKRYSRKIGDDAETCKTPHEFLASVNSQLNAAAA
ncbi:acyl carrier protein [Streptomyces sp. NBC_00669]|uniref:acyl carrier protein n=1 Tax=unclassified Streptomyces TaxID=2593676 RepID=UPI002E1FFE2D|nr:MULTISPECIES: acyl carrier protein [unclassified Streptomyces]